MTLYFNNSGFFNALFALIAGIATYIILPYLHLSEGLYQSQTNLVNTLITLGSTLLGFLLTVVTIIITFKNSYKTTENKSQEKDYVKEGTTIFDSKVDKEKLFYGTPMYYFVTKVFLAAIFEIGISLSILILLHFALNKSYLYYSLPVVISVLTLVLLAMFKSLYIFKLFLNVHS